MEKFLEAVEQRIRRREVAVIIPDGTCAVGVEFGHERGGKTQLGFTCPPVKPALL